MGKMSWLGWCCGLLALAGCGSSQNAPADDTTGETGGDITSGSGGAAGTSDAGAEVGTDGASPADGAAGCAHTDGAKVTVCPKKQGITLKYQGVNGGGAPATAAADLAEAGIGAVRVGIKMIGTAATPFDGKTKDQVLADPTVLDWTAVEAYFGTRLKDWLTWAHDNKGVALYGMLWGRNKLPSTECASGEMTFNVGDATDENLVWTLVFGYAYWANVINGLGTEYIELSNEPDNCGGNGTTQVNIAGQNRIMQLGHDAFTYVNTKLVSPPIRANMMGPGVLTESSKWVSAALADPPTRDAMDIVSWHAYWDYHWFGQVEDCAADVNQRTQNGKKQWLTEWGQWWHPSGYSDTDVVAQMAGVMPKLGLMGVEVHMPWALYSSKNLTNGLIQDGVKSRLFYDMKILGMALLSEKNVLTTDYANTRDDIVLSYATQDTTDLYVIYMNNDSAGGTVVIDVSQIAGSEGKTVHVFAVGDAEYAVPDMTVSAGRFSFKQQGNEHYVAQIVGAGAP
jgi:hypothetical protein